ncbi:hypothetical protein DEO72_LG2g3095 [Vigna unguiculata]|uniref:Uncharacterized protein n=1 Tax=Vigna unguiculata TaxID=3917 RepID=A0A4D6L2S8_VIGUN|nr:hypothetical protein DEO72_LG2g3095 [Vigna unguiculata]
MAAATSASPSQLHHLYSSHGNHRNTVAHRQREPAQLRTPPRSKLARLHYSICTAPPQFSHHLFFTDHDAAAPPRPPEQPPLPSTAPSRTAKGGRRKEQQTLILERESTLRHVSASDRTVKLVNSSQLVNSGQLVKVNSQLWSKLQICVK